MTARTGIIKGGRVKWAPESRINGKVVNQSLGLAFPTHHRQASSQLVRGRRAPETRSCITLHRNIQKWPCHFLLLTVVT